MAYELKIDLRTGKIAPELPPEAERDARTMQLLEDLERELPELEAKVGADGRTVLLRCFVLKTYFDAHPRNWINDRAQRRRALELEERLDKLVASAKESTPDGEWLWGECPYVRETLEKLHVKQKAENEVDHLILTPLGSLEHSKIDYQRRSAEDLARVCQEVAQAVRSSADLEDEVLRWGPENRGALLHGRELSSVPPALQPPMAAASGALLAGMLLVVAGAAMVLVNLPLPAGARYGLGAVLALLGVGAIGFGLSQQKVAKARLAALPGEFAALSKRFRERLYLICALRTIDAHRSRYAQASEAFREHLQNSGGQQRWKKAKFDARDLTELLAGDTWDQRGTVELWLAEKVKETFRLDVTKLAGPEELDAEAWGVIQKAYELESLDTASLTEARLLDIVSDLMFTRRGEDTKAERKRVFDQVRAAWEGSSLKARGANE
ncbi:MAG: hypothetical protein AB7N76_33490 [Planctomycetota bacterium]